MIPDLFPLESRSKKLGSRHCATTGISKGNPLERSLPGGCSAHRTREDQILSGLLHIIALHVSLSEHRTLQNLMADHRFCHVLPFYPSLNEILMNWGELSIPIWDELEGIWIWCCQLAKASWNAAPPGQLPVFSMAQASWSFANAALNYQPTASGNIQSAPKCTSH